MTLLSRLLLFGFLATTFAFAGACVQQQNNPTPPVTSTTPAPSPVASPATTQTNVQITLPLLDALLSDEGFERELRAKLKLTDDQLVQLKRVSEAEIGRLRQSNAETADDDGPSGTNASTRASEELRKILGDEKATQLASFAHEYWAKGDPNAEGARANSVEMSKGPNAVPTDTRVVVNIPAFRMDLFQNGSLVKSYKVGIGYPEFPLPFGLRKAQTVIFNPPWTPPDSPWVADIKNAKPGETIEPGSKDNPLGIIKIPIGLPSLIHGGKSAAKIGKFASHGCVGLTNAQVKDFATQLLRVTNKEVSDQEIAKYLEDKTQTKTVKLDQVVPVELRYETIVLEDGKLHIYKDVYAQDTNTEENLRRVLEANGARFEDLTEDQRRQALDALNAMSANPNAAATASATSSPSPSPSPDKKTARTAKKKAPQMEVVIDVTALAGKGYPVAVNLDTGSGKPPATQKKRSGA